MMNFGHIEFVPLNARWCLLILHTSGEKTDSDTQNVSSVQWTMSGKFTIIRKNLQKKKG